MASESALRELVLCETRQLRETLQAIAMLGGNLPDDRLTYKSGPNDSVSRGLMYVEARRLAREALEKLS